MNKKKRLKRAVYLEKKRRDLTEFEKLQIRQRLENGESDTAKTRRGVRLCPNPDCRD